MLDKVIRLDMRQPTVTGIWYCVHTDRKDEDKWMDGQTNGCSMMFVYYKGQAVRIGRFK